MRYIILAAGRGTRLKPLTSNTPKSLFKLDENCTLIERTVQIIKECDSQSEIIVVVGYKHEQFENLLSGVVEFICNPFFDVTNSAASLWLARRYLKEAEHIVIINADIVASRKLMKDIICRPVNAPTVLLDSSIKTNGDYNVEVMGKEVLVMSKELKEYYGEYAGVTMLDKAGAERLYREVEKMMNDGAFDQWYENALVNAIFSDHFTLNFIDICDYEWTEVDDVNDLVYAKKIYNKGKNL